MQQIMAQMQVDTKQVKQDAVKLAAEVDRNQDEVIAAIATLHKQSTKHLHRYVDHRFKSIFAHNYYNARSFTSTVWSSAKRN
jgi:hypothetical protein